MQVNRLRRIVAGGVAGLLAVGPIVAVAPAASAAQVGTLAIEPASGTWQTGIVVTMSGPCPGGTNLFAKVYGAGFPAAGFNVVANSTQASYPTDATTGGKRVALSNTMKAFAESQSPPASLSGEYRIELICRNSLSFGGPTNTGFGEFNGKINFTTPTDYVAVVPPVVTTSVSVSAIPAGSQVAGANVTFTAAVTAGDGSLEAGSVQFKDGAADLGAPQAVAAGASGTASVSTTALSVGSHSISAVFTSTAGPQTGSTATAIPYSITAPAATDTSTVLSSSPQGRHRPVHVRGRGRAQKAGTHPRGLVFGCQLLIVSCQDGMRTCLKKLKTYNEQLTTQCWPNPAQPRRMA